MLIFASALVMAIGGTPVVRRLALRLGVIDRPSARKIHVNPIPLLGGVAIYGAFIAALLLFGKRFRLDELLGILVGASLMSFLVFFTVNMNEPPSVYDPPLAFQYLSATGRKRESSWLSE